MSILEISEQACHLASFRGFITLSVKKKEIHRIAFDHVSNVITKAHGITYTHNLLVKLADYNIPLIVTDKSFMPVSVTLPLSSHHQHSKILASQINANSGSNNKRWQNIIKNKIRQQIAALEYLGLDASALEPLLQFIVAGDKKNIEAQAAKIYWSLLFGPEFKRSRYGATPNEMLNYGYIIFRSTIARYVCASGLHPAIGIKHQNQYNPFCLVDDLIEPYRPLIDICVYKLLSAGMYELNPQTKKYLTKQLEQKIRIGNKWLRVEDSMKKLCQSLAKSLASQSYALLLPKANMKRLDFTDIENETIRIPDNVDGSNV